MACGKVEVALVEVAVKYVDLVCVPSTVRVGDAPKPTAKVQAAELVKPQPKAWDPPA